MLASDVISLVDNGGLIELSKAFAISRRQAENLERRARRAMLSGANPLMAPGDESGSIRAAQRPQEPTEPSEPIEQQDEAAELEEQARSHARRIKSESAGVAGASVAQLRSRLAVLERNIRAGYGAEWDYDLRLTKRTLELVEGVNA
jgi:hypothetical protein